MRDGRAFYVEPVSQRILSLGNIVAAIKFPREYCRPVTIFTWVLGRLSVNTVAREYSERERCQSGSFVETMIIPRKLDTLGGAPPVNGWTYHRKKALTLHGDCASKYYTPCKVCPKKIHGLGTNVPM